MKRRKRRGKKKKKKKEAERGRLQRLHKGYTLYISKVKRCRCIDQPQHGSGASVIVRLVERTTWSMVERSVASVVVSTICPRRNNCRHWNNWSPLCRRKIQTRTAAGQAEQRAMDAETRILGERTEGVVDTRLLGKPQSFDGATDNWRQFKFTFLGFAGAVDARLKQAMIESEVMQETAITNSALPARDQQVSTQLYYMQVLLLEGRRNACWNTQAMVRS